MRIALLGHSIPAAGPGVSLGIARYIYSLGRGLRNAGNDVELFIRNDKPVNEKWIKTIYAPKFSWVPYPIFASPRMFCTKTDVYHSDFVTTGAALVWAKRRPVVVSMHDAIPFTYGRKEWSSWGVRWYMKCFKSAKKADAVILMSEYARDEALRLTDLDPENVHAIYNGIDHDVFRPLPRKRHGKIRIGYLGGLDGRKNVGLLIDAFRRLQEERGDIELHVAGGGRNLEPFRSLNVKNAFFYGQTNPEKATDFYNNLDIFVMPSLQEGFGMMTLEAMSCGVPVVGVSRSSTPEIIGDAGVLVEPEREEMAKAISKLVDNKKRRENIAKRCLERSMAFSWKKCANDTMEVYRGLK